MDACGREHDETAGLNGLDFLGLQPTEDPNRWRLPVTLEMLSGMGALFGGVRPGRGGRGHGAHHRPAPRVGHRAVPVVRPAAVGPRHRGRRRGRRGHQISQARAVGQVDDDEILTVNAALGHATPTLAGQWAVCPTCRRPRSARRALPTTAHEGTIVDRDRDAPRQAPRRSTSSRARRATAARALWARLPGLEMSAATLAILGDYVPFGIGQALGMRAGGNSLDNTLRRRAAACRPTGCCSTSACTPSPTASATGSCTCGPRTARCSPPPASRRSSGAGRSDPEPSRRTTTERRRTASPSRSTACRCTSSASGIEELADLGYTDVWSSEADGTDAFTPLALAAAWAPSLRLGMRHRPRVHPRSRRSWPERGEPWPRPRPAGSPSASARRPTSSSSAGTASRSTSPTSARATWSASCARRSPARRSTSEYDTFKVKGFRLGPRARRQPPPILVAALRQGMLRLAGREGDGAIINWLSADDVQHGGAATSGDGQGDRGPHLRVPDRRRRRGAGHGPLRDRRLPQRAGLRRLPRVARPGRALAADVGAWKAGDRKAALGAIPDEVVDDLIVHGSPEECRDHIGRYVDNGVTTPALAILPLAAAPRTPARPCATSARPTPSGPGTPATGRNERSALSNVCAA